MPGVPALAVVRHCVRRIAPIALLVGGVTIAPLHFELSTGGLASSASWAKNDGHSGGGNSGGAGGNSGGSGSSGGAGNSSTAGDAGGGTAGSSGGCGS
jgi:hypothetical protein